MATEDQSVVLVTGANGGIGFELAAQLLADPTYFVLLGCRSREKGKAAVKVLEERGIVGGVEILLIDVSDEASIKKAAKSVEERFGRLDALVNNAAITGNEPESASLFERMQSAFQTNSTGPAIIVEEFVSLLSKSKKTVRIINVSSGAGSITLRTESKSAHQSVKMLPYRTSKAALNMLTVCQAWEYGHRGWKVFSHCPGFTVSGIAPANTEGNGAQPTSEGARPLVGILRGERDEEHGKFLRDGGVWPW